MAFVVEIVRHQKELDAVTAASDGRQCGYCKMAEMRQPSENVRQLIFGALLHSVIVESLNVVIAIRKMMKLAVLCTWVLLIQEHIPR